MDVTKLVELILAILGAVWTCFLIPWLRDRKNTEDLNHLADTIKMAVQAAEQIYAGSGKGREKKAHVLTWLRGQGVVMDEPAIIEMVDAMIESAVLELKSGESK